MKNMKKEQLSTIYLFDFDGTVAEAIAMLKSIESNFPNHQDFTISSECGYDEEGRLVVFGYREFTDKEKEKRKKQEEKRKEKERLQKELEEKAERDLYEKLKKKFHDA